MRVRIVRVKPSHMYHVHLTYAHRLRRTQEHTLEGLLDPIDHNDRRRGISYQNDTQDKTQSLAVGGSQYTYLGMKRALISLRYAPRLPTPSRRGGHANPYRL